VWANITVVTKDQYYGALFSNTSNILYLLSGQVTTSTPGTIFTILDNRGRQYPLKLTVTPPTYSVSQNVTVYRYDNVTGFPITFTAPTISSGQLSIPRTFSTLTVVGDSTFPRSNAVRFTNFNFSPLLPTGITASMDGFGIVTLSGTPTVTRAPAVYTMYTRTGINQTVATSTTIQVLPARFQFSNVLGYNASFGATLVYKASNELKFGCRPAPASAQITSTISGMNLSVVGSNVVFSGIPTDFLDTPTPVTVNVIGPQYTTPITLTFSMNPCLELIYTDVSVYAGYTYTPADPFFSIKAIARPTSTSQIGLTLAQGLPGLQMTSTGVFYGKIATASLGNRIIVNAVDPLTSLSNTATLTLDVINDIVTVNTTLSGVPITQFNCSENVQYFVQASAFTESKRPITSYSVESSVLFPGLLDISASTGLLFIVPHESPPGTTPFVFNICAYTEATMGNRVITANVTSDTLRFDYRYGLARFSNTATPFTVVQGRPIDQLDYDDYVIAFTASATSAREVRKYWLSDEFLESGLSVNSLTGTISGIPVFTGMLAGFINAGTIDHVLARSRFYVYAISDQLIIASPATTDFITSLGNVKTFQLTAYAFSVSPIISYGLSGAPRGVLITSTGLVTVTGQAFQVATPFDITALTHDGITLTYPASVTVNNPVPGSFVSPIGSDLLFIPYNESYPVVTNPSGLTVTYNGTNQISLIGSNLVNTSTNLLYPPSLVSLSLSSNMTIPVRITSRYLQPFVIGQPSTHWVQYVPIQPITVSAATITTPVVFTVPFPPRGTRWNPITSTLKGFAYDLTIESSFVTYACDGNTVQPIVINYSSRTPAYLRMFSAPSSYTNYVKQRAFINAAVHAIDNLAILPDPILASETAPYPIDVCTNVICGKCKVETYIPVIANVSGWSPYRESDWFVTPTSVKYVGTSNVAPYTFLHTTYDYTNGFIRFNGPTVNAGPVDVGFSPLNVNTSITFGYRFTSSKNVSFVAPTAYAIQRISPATLSYSTAEDFSVVYYDGLVYYLVQGTAVAQTTVPYTGPLAISTLMGRTNDTFSNMIYGFGTLDVSAGSNWYVRDGRSWTIGSNFVTYSPSTTISLYTSTIVKNTPFTGSYFKFTVQSNVVGTAGFTDRIDATTVSYGFLMAVDSGYGLLGTNVTALSATQRLNVGEELAIVTSGSNSYYLKDSVVVGIAPYTPQTKYALVQLTRSGGSLSNIDYGNGTGGYSLLYGYLNAPSTKWITTINPYNSITHIASSTDTTYSFLTDSNIYITGQPHLIPGKMSFGLSNSLGSTFRIAFNDPTSGVYSTYSNTTQVVVGAFSPTSYYAISVSGRTLNYYQNGTSIRTVTDVSGTSRAFITSDTNGDAIIPVSIGNDLFLNIVTSPGNMLIANNYVEKRSITSISDTAFTTVPYADFRLDLTFIVPPVFANRSESQFYIASTAVGEPLFEFNVYVDSVGSLVVNRMLESGLFQVTASIPANLTTGNIVGAQVQGTTITVFNGNTAIATFPTKFGRTGLTAPWKAVFYGGGQNRFTAKNIVLTPL